MRECAYCKYFSEPFDQFGHLLHARCMRTNEYTNHQSTCKHWERGDFDVFFTDLNDEDQ